MGMINEKNNSNIFIKFFLLNSTIVIQKAYIIKIEIGINIFMIIVVFLE